MLGRGEEELGVLLFHFQGVVFEFGAGGLRGLGPELLHGASEVGDRGGRGDGDRAGLVDGLERVRGLAGEGRLDLGQEGGVPLHLVLDLVEVVRLSQLVTRLGVH